MPKQLNGFMVLSKEEYDKIERRDDGQYYVKVATMLTDLTEEIKEKIFEDVLDGISKPNICKKYGMSDYTFNLLAEKTFGNHKITVIRESLRDRRAEKKADLAQKKAQLEAIIAPIIVANT
jgi:hypothetical protein